MELAESGLSSYPSASNPLSHGRIQQTIHVLYISQNESIFPRNSEKCAVVTAGVDSEPDCWGLHTLPPQADDWLGSQLVDEPFLLG